MGKKTYDPEAGPAKIAKEMTKFPHVEKFGFQFTGMQVICTFNPIALRMAKTLWSFGRSECNRMKSLKLYGYTSRGSNSVISTFDSILNPIVLRKAKIVCNFGLSECSKVNGSNC